MKMHRDDAAFACPLSDTRMPERLLLPDLPDSHHFGGHRHWPHAKDSTTVSLLNSHRLTRDLKSVGSDISLIAGVSLLGFQQASVQRHSASHAISYEAKSLSTYLRNSPAIGVHLARELTLFTFLVNVS